jgi:class 3 adenylate cyclase
MTDEPDIRYAKSGGVHIAYQVLGDGAVDLVALPGFTSHLEWMWEDPASAAMWRRLASFSRLIVLDKRGTGLSDRVPDQELPTLEQRMDDVRAVMDAAGSRQAALLAFWEGGPMSVLFAATYPERTRALILFGTPASFSQSDDYPWGFAKGFNDEFVGAVSEFWGKGNVYARLAPSLANDPAALRRLGRLERMGASPGAVIALWRMNLESDVRGILSSVRVPTLVLNRTDDPIVPAAASRWLAERIPGARYVELPGRDHLPWVGDFEPVAAEVQQFLTGVRGEVSADRVLATILFVDIVESTALAARLGDARWRELLDEFLATSRRVLEQYRGLMVNTTGDGFLARFDGPARAIRCAQTLAAVSERLGLRVRAGLHTGECELRGDDVGGLAVHIAARVVERAEPGAVLASGTVKDLVAGSGIGFADRGSTTLRGVPGEWRLYAAEGVAERT